MCEDWASINVRLFGHKETFEKMGKEFALMTLSHRGDLDWVAGYVVAARFNFIHVSIQCVYGLDFMFRTDAQPLSG